MPQKKPVGGILPKMRNDKLPPLRSNFLKTQRNTSARVGFPSVKNSQPRIAQKTTANNLILQKRIEAEIFDNLPDADKTTRN